MNYKKLSFASFIIAPILIAGCTGSTGPAGPLLSGSITGVVQLFNADGSMPIDRSGVTVSIPGTAFSTTTDSLGQWALGNLTTGSYTITETKPGYGMSEQQDVQLVSGTVVDAGSNSRTLTQGGDIVMAQPPIFSVGIDSSNTVSDTLYVWFTMIGKFDTIANSSTNCFLIVVGQDSSVNGGNPNSYKYFDIAEITSSLGKHSYDYFPPTELEYAGFTSGSNAYIIIYPLGVFVPGYNIPFSSYYDVATDKFVYTSVGTPSKVIKVKVP